MNTLRRLLLGIVLVAVSAGHARAATPVELREETLDGKPVFRLENYRIRAIVDPARGGAVVSYVDKLGGNVDLVPKTRGAGLFLDHFQAQVWPGELLEVPYTAKIIKTSPEECILEVSRTAIGKWNNHNFPELAGVVVQKQYILRADSPALVGKVRLTAPADRPTTLAFWSQAVFFAGGTYDREDLTFRPSTRGVRVKSRDKHGMLGPEGFLKDFTAGWVALMDPKAKSGLAILADYDDLKFLYVSEGNMTAEHMFNMTYIPAGSSAEFTTTVVPVAGLDNVVAATQDFIAGYSMNSDNKGSGEVSLDFVRSASPARDLSVSVSIRNVVEPGLVVKAGELDVTKLGDKPQTVKTKFEGAGVDPLVLDVSGEVTAGLPEPRPFRFEEFFVGAYRWAENINTDMVTAFYIGERPPQKIKLQRPEKLTLRRPGANNVLFFEGLLDDSYRIVDAVNLVSLNGISGTERKQSHAINQASFGNTVTYFPYNYEELLNFNYIIFGGVMADALGPIGMEMLADYQKAGGGMIVLGGPASYGPSGYAGTRFEELLPVKISKKPFSLVDVQSAPLEKNGDHPVFQGLDWSGKPSVRFMQDIEVKPWGKVLLTAGGKPFLVVGETPGKARVACILGAPMGTLAGQEALPFWEWDEWPYLMRQLIWWVSKNEQRFAVQPY